MSDYIQFDNFTENARQALTLAYQEAATQKHYYMGTEQLLLGLADEKNGVAGKVLAQLQLSPNNIKNQAALSQHRIFVPNGATGASPLLYKIFEAAIDRATKAGQNYVTTGHLLLCLISNGDALVKDVLETAKGGTENVQTLAEQLLQQVNPNSKVEN